jgi:mevalonate kinase
MNQAVGEAPGKILLIGEHSVVYGHPAIAVPLRGVCARAEVELTRAGGVELEAVELREVAQSGGKVSDRLAPLLRLVGSVLDSFGEAKQGLRIRLQSTIPIGRGMGSGAAVSVALVRGVCGALGRKLDADQVAELAMEAEKEFHGAPSGVDCAVVARDEPIYFVKGKPPQEVIVGPNVFRFVVADTGIESPTLRVVQDVREARERNRALYDSYFWELGAMASVAREVIRSGVPAELGACMSHSHGILQSLGVSCPELDHLVEAAMEKGALGAKLTGAGRGGAIIALIDDEADGDRLGAELRMAGADNVFTTFLGVEPELG